MQANWRNDSQHQLQLYHDTSAQLGYTVPFTLAIKLNCTKPQRNEDKYTLYNGNL